ncbi:type II toxin-antitoxin system HigA family antitoxin [Rufibacter sediminis]|uniref:Transcriptional regulator n=1 Tax=Rufibacter sediminis TaxID=2762756 RepID=A0ABR6W1C3_9BACT|nr:transcriptional regulator [Rufibacter sediminis]MBC3542436.1 transcriptional regulator [Rufibacter sediminis]
MISLKLIETEEEYEQMLARIDEIFNATPGSAEAKELELLMLIVNKYEEEHYAIEEPDPIDYIKTRMEELGLKQEDLVPYMGNKGNVSKVLNRKRGLSLEMIRNLHKALGFPLEVLVAEPTLHLNKGAA